MSKLLRVRQYDAIILDQEIAKLIKNMVESATNYLPPGLIVPYEPEIDLILNLLILTNSVWRKNCTFGQQLFLIKYENLTDIKKFLYILFSCSGYFKEKLQRWKPRHGLNGVFEYLEVVSKILDFINLSIFLKTGKMPRLIDRILGLSQVHTAAIVPREQTNKYLTRELLWNGLIELFVFVLPLVNFYKLKRIIRNVNPLSKKNLFPELLATDKRILNINTKCPHCNENPIKPHHMGCEHVFCYVCLKSNLLADEKYECPACGYSGEKCEVYQRVA